MRAQSAKIGDPYSERRWIELSGIRERDFFALVLVVREHG